MGRGWSSTNSKGNLRRVRVLDNPEKIASTGLNRGIREARGEIIIRMDAHSTYAADYVRSCVEVLHETNAENVGGPALTRADGYIAQAIAFAFHTPFATGGAKFRDPRYEGPVDTVTYGCWRKSTLERIGMFDEKLVRGQDDELNFRMVFFPVAEQCGSRPESFPGTGPEPAFQRLFWQYFQNGFWKVAVVRKHGRLASWRNLVPGSCLLAGAILLLCAAAASLGGLVWWRDIIPCRLVYVGRVVFHRIFCDSFFCREAGRVGLLSLLARRFCYLSFVLRARFCSGPVVSSRDPGPAKSHSESPYGHHKIISNPRSLAPVSP